MLMGSSLVPAMLSRCRGTSGETRVVSQDSFQRLGVVLTLAGLWARQLVR
jgi:hypothetical protein